MLKVSMILYPYPIFMSCNSHRFRHVPADKTLKMLKTHTLDFEHLADGTHCEPGEKQKKASAAGYDVVGSRRAAVFSAQTSIKKLIPTTSG